MKLLRDGNPSCEQGNGIAALINSLIIADNMAALILLKLPLLLVAIPRRNRDRAVSSSVCMTEYLSQRMVTVFRRHYYSMLDKMYGEMRQVR